MNTIRFLHLVISILCIATVGIYIGGVFIYIENVKKHLLFNLGFAIVPFIIFLLGIWFLSNAINGDKK